MSEQIPDYPIAEFIRIGQYAVAQELEKLERAKTGGDYLGELGSANTEEWLSKFLTMNLPELKPSVRALTPKRSPVLILGESGVGKELIAKALHGPRSGKFIPINCTSLPDLLLESELFGHKKGSFTDAISDKEGLLLEAARGTIFLDEIGDMPLVLQAKLLRVLQDNKIRRVGSNVEEPISCRFILATNQNVSQLVKEGKFRLDLYYRISTFEIFIPPLIERPEDIGLILKSLTKKTDFPLQKLLEENPTLEGNVRELQRRVERWKTLGRI